MGEPLDITPPFCSMVRASGNVNYFYFSKKKILENFKGLNWSPEIRWRSQYSQHWLLFIFLWSDSEKKNTVNTARVRDSRTRLRFRSKSATRYRMQYLWLSYLFWSLILYCIPSCIPQFFGGNFYFKCL